MSGPEWTDGCVDAELDLWGEEWAAPARRGFITSQDIQQAEVVDIDGELL